MYLDKLRLDGRVAVVTGGGRGIGLCCVDALCEAGAAAVILDLDPAVAEDGRAKMAAKGYTVEAHQVDVTDSKALTALADALADKHGRIDVCVASAGIGITGTGAEDVPDDEWLKVNDVNYNALFWTNRAFGRHMLKAGKGSIVNIGSMSGLIVNRPSPQAAYNASKAGVHHLTKCLAAEWGARGVRVNAVAPTYIATPMTLYADEALKRDWLRDTPMGRLGQPEEVASAVHFLASDASSLMTGAIVVTDAGLTLW